MFNAFIPAAGLGTRLYPLTKDKPKALVEVSGKPLLEHQLLKLKKEGVRQVVVNVHHFAEQIIDFLASNNDFGLQISISDEREQLLDTGGGLKKALSLFESSLPILVHNVDVYSDLPIQNILQFHKMHNALATLVVRERKSSRFLQFDDSNHLCGWKNTKNNERKIVKESAILFDYAFSGIQIVSMDIADKIEEKGVFSVIDMYLRLAKEECILSFLDRESNWADLGKIEQFKEVEKLFE